MLSLLLLQLNSRYNTLQNHQKVNLMENIGNKNPSANLDYLGIKDYKTAYWNSTPEELDQFTTAMDEGVILKSGALLIKTGKFTGRSPQDRFIVKDKITEDRVDWGNINFPFESNDFDQLENKITKFLSGKDLYVKDAIACADSRYQLKIRLVAEKPWSAKFAHNMFLRPSAEEIQNFNPEWNIICAPSFKADPDIDHTRQDNFAIINFSKKLIIIGGTGYTGEIKKGIFSVLNFLLPTERNVFPMHCSSNVGADGDTAVFFGLSGTGKTTLSADPNRKLIGDDEHGWSDDAVFNFEGGCYAKCIDLSEEKEPDIYRAIKSGAILENIVYNKETLEPDFEDDSITQNTRVSYPIHHIDNVMPGCKSGNPKNIFFLTCDAFGVLPPLSKLTKAQAMYYFISGYTAKVAGTEVGIVEPKATFSACFGAPFLPLHPTEYAEMLGDKMNANDVNVWLVNTGWSGGSYGEGKRMSLKYTRAMITAVLDGKLEDTHFENTPIFNLAIPKTCPNVPDVLMNPRNTWKDQETYDSKASHLAELFNQNFEAFANKANDEILNAAPKVNLAV